MKPIALSDIKGPALYAGMRDDFRRRIIELKQHRRISVGDRVTLVFENRHTLIFQIEEILRAEQITHRDQIQAELDVYNPLLPTGDSLSATLFLEVPPGADPRVELDRLIGLDEHVIVHIGPHPVRAEFEEGRATEERISAVQYIRFRLPAEARAALASPGTPLAIEIDHPEYGHRIAASDQMRASLSADLAQG
jgi:Protein of unknown function (DUF3501)